MRASFNISARNIVLIILLSVCITPSYAQPASPTTRPQKLQKLYTILKELNQSRGIYFFITDAAMGDIMVNTAELEKQDRPEKILEQLLYKTGLKYRRLDDRTFVIIPLNNNPVNLSTNLPGNAADSANSKRPSTQLIRGKVINQLGEPISGATIILKGVPGSGTLTNPRGEFELEATVNTTLLISNVGYVSREIRVDNSAGRDYVVAELDMKDIEMSEVIITAFEMKRKARSLGYPVSVVKSKQLNDAGNSNFASALYGKAPGVQILSAPGGATSAVHVQVRGLNSLNFNAQPMIIVDGIVIRNANERGYRGLNNNGYWDDPRIRGNGLLDINPEDIESLSVLKGANATALYGSEAASGAIIISTQKASAEPGLKVGITYSGNIEQAAFMPRYQRTYGPGYDRATNLSEGADEFGWIHLDSDGDGREDTQRPNFGAFAQFGPRMDGQMVPWWDGSMQSYSPRPNNYRDLYRTGFSSRVNATVSNQQEKSAYRLSYTRHDYKGIQVGGDMQRNTLHLSSTLRFTSKMSADIVTLYTKSKVHNRPYQLSRITASYSGFLNRADDASIYFNNYKTSQGYKWVRWNQTQLNPAEALRYNMKGETLDFLWMQLKNSENEFQDRVINSVTFNYDLAKDIRFRGRVGNDFTNLRTDTKRFNEYPTAFNSINSTGYYGTQSGRYSILYGDALLTYSRKLNSKWNIALNTGYQARREKYNDQSTSTTGGLVKENWFNFNNSFGALSNTHDRTELLKYAYLGFVNLGYKNLLFLEGTARYEYSSTLPPGRNHYFYSSANGAFVFSDVFKLPKIIDYGKLRLSYGTVGNAPPAYASAITYTQVILPTATGPVPSLGVQANAGNNQIRPENKYDAEAGIEINMFRNRLGFDLTFYNSRVVDQIVQLTVPASTGAISKLINGGELRSNGIEASIHGRPISNRNLTWDVNLNFASNKTRVTTLGNGVKEVVYYSGEQNAVRVVAEEGKEVGNIYVYPRLTNDKGEFIIGSNGLYVIDNSRYMKAGNIMPRLIGGVSNSVTWKQFSLECMVDYRFGGSMVSPVVKYNMGAGMYENTMQYRDQQHGGLPYYVNSAGVRQLLPDHASVAPNGGTVFHDGILLEGVDAMGNKNNVLTDAATYYMNMYGWGPNSLNESGMVFKNSYVKLRELVVSYSLPSKNTKKAFVSEVRFSLVGRNLFYFYRTLKHTDPETALGSNWARQGIDEGSMAANRSIGFSIRMGF